MPHLCPEVYRDFEDIRTGGYKVHLSPEELVERVSVHQNIKGMTTRVKRLRKNCAGSSFTGRRKYPVSITNRGTADRQTEL